MINIINNAMCHEVLNPIRIEAVISVQLKQTSRTFKQTFKTHLCAIIFQIIVLVFKIVVKPVNI